MITHFTIPEQRLLKFFLTSADSTKVMFPAVIVTRPVALGAIDGLKKQLVHPGSS